MINKDLKNAPVKVIRENNDFTITAYLDFAGDYNQYVKQPQIVWPNIVIPGVTYKQAVIDGIEEYWSSPEIGASTKYDFDGSAITVKTSVIVKGSQTVSSGQQFVTFNIITDPAGGKTAMTSGYYDNWSVAGTGNGKRVVDLYTVSINATTTDYFGRSAGHEFGHVLGIGDAYAPTGYGFNAAPVTSEVPPTDFMRASNPATQKVSANDMEMVWEAYLTGKWQYFTDWPGHGTQSTVIRHP